MFRGHTIKILKIKEICCPRNTYDIININCILWKSNHSDRPNLVYTEGQNMTPSPNALMKISI